MSEPSYVEDRGNGAKRIRISLGNDPVTGKRLRPSRTVRGSDKDVTRVRAQMLAGVGRLTDSRMTVADFVDTIFVPYQRSRVAAGKIRRRTADGYEEKARLYIVPHLGKTRLCDLSPDMCDRWLLAIAASGISERTQLHAYRVFQQVLTRAKRATLITSSPLDDVTAPHPVVTRPDTLSVEEVLAYVEGFRGSSVFAGVVISLATGARRSEMVALEWGRGVVLESPSRGHVTVAGGVHQAHGETWEEAPKSVRSARTVLLPAWACAELWPLRGLGPVLVEDGHRMSPGRYTYHYRRRVAAANLRYVPLKNLRHTHATLVLDATGDLKAVADRMGHSTSAITDTYYIGARAAADEKMAAAMDAMILGPIGATGPDGATSVRQRVHR